MGTEVINTVVDGRPSCLADQFTDAVKTLVDIGMSLDEKRRAIHILAELCNATILEPEDGEQEIEFADYSSILLDLLEEEDGEGEENEEEKSAA